VKKKTIVVEKTETDKTASYASFVAALPPEDCRYAVFDFTYETKQGGVRNKVVFLAWAPDRSGIKTKMVYAASKDAFKKKLVGLAVEVQATDMDELNEKAIIEKCR